MGKASRNTSGSPTKKASAVSSSVRVYECTDVRRHLLDGLKYRARYEHGGKIPEGMEDRLQEKVNSLALSRMIITGWDESSQALPKKLAPLALFIFKSVKREFNGSVDNCMQEEPGSSSQSMGELLVPLFAGLRVDFASPFAAANSDSTLTI